MRRCGSFARRLLAFLVVGLLAPMALAQGPELEVRFDPPTFGVEDVALLNVVVIHAGKSNQKPRLGELKNLVVVAGPVAETQFSIINGVGTSSVRFVYRVRPEKVGQARVGPIEVTVGDTELVSEPVTAEVVAGSVIPQSASPQRRRLNPFDGFGGPRGTQREARVFLRQLLASHQPFLGEPVVVSIVLDTNIPVIGGFSWISAPTFPGWWAQRVEATEPTAQQVVEVEGQRYYRFHVVSFALVPLRSGELTLPAASAQIGIRGRSLFGPRQVIERSTQEVKVQVRDRPAAPEGFAGAVGQFRYSARLEPERIEYGESAVLTIELAGSGNLPLVDHPSSWPICDDCDTYPPEEESDVQVDTSGIRGTRTWRMTLVPRRWGRLSLQPVLLAFFDPQAGTYRRQAIGSELLIVEAPPVTPTPAAGSQGAVDAGGSVPAVARGPVRAGAWLWIVAALLVGGGAGGLVTWLITKTRPLELPPRQKDVVPADRARELQVALERWWMTLPESQAAQMKDDVEVLRREIEAVRFAPGRADHTETIIELEQRLKRLVRRA